MASEGKVPRRVDHADDQVVLYAGRPRQLHPARLPGSVFGGDQLLAMEKPGVAAGARADKEPEVLVWALDAGPPAADDQQRPDLRAVRRD